MPERHISARRVPAGRLVLAAAASLLLISLALAACSVIGGSREPAAPTLRPTDNIPADQVNPLPTPRPDQPIDGEARSAAKNTPEGTWEGYLRDSIAYQVSAIQNKLLLLRRYENPDHTAQNTGGLLTDVALLEDRTSWNTSGRMATAVAEYDIRVTFLDGDTQTRTCRHEVQMQLDEEDGVWYVIAPKGLDIYVLCGR